MSIFFWLIIIALTVIIVASVLKPLLSKQHIHIADRQSYLVEVYQDRLQQLQQQLQTDQISRPQFENAQRELELAFAQDLPPASESPKPAPAKKGLALPLIIGISIPALALLTYFNIGSFNKTVHQQANTNPSVEEMISALEQRLAAQEHDLEGWLLLGRSYMTIEQFDKAQYAFTTAYKIAPDNTEIMLNLAEVMGYNNNNSLAGEPEKLITKALQLDPASRRGRWLSGIVAFQKGQRQEAIAVWQALLAEDSSNTQEGEVLNTFIAQAQQGSTPKDTSTGNTPTERKEVSGPQVEVNVSLALESDARVKPTDTVFIFARATQGPRMPLAIIRATVADLPLAVTLSDSNAMMPQMKLSAFDNVVIGARISKTGDAIASPGDLQALSQPLNPSKGPAVNLVIAEQIP